MTAEILTRDTAMQKTPIERQIDTLEVLRNWQAHASGYTGQSLTQTHKDPHFSEAEPFMDYLQVEKLLMSLDVEKHRAHLVKFRWTMYAVFDSGGSHDQKLARDKVWNAIYDTTA